MTVNSLFSSMLRSGRTTYFIDVKETKNGKRYLSITENTLSTDEKTNRVTIRVFKESVDQFRQAVEEAIQALNL